MAVRQVDGPDVTIIPWINIVILGFLAFIVFMVRRMWLQFRERTIDPALDDVAETWDDVEDSAGAARDRAVGAWGKFTAWLGTWKSKPRR